MSKLPRITSRELIRALERAGFAAIRQRGSHVFLQHADGRSTVVPVIEAKVWELVYCEKFCVMQK